MQRQRIPEERKIELLKEFDALPPDASKREFFQRHGIHSNSKFYQWRKRYHAQQAQGVKPGEGVLVTAAGRTISPEARQRIRDASKRRWAQFHARRAGRPSKSQCPFNEASREEKQRLLNEYDSLPQKGKQEWRLRNLGTASPHNGILTYYRKQFEKEAKRVPSVALVKHQAPERDEAALLTEYDALQGAGVKGQWLQARGLKYAHIHVMRGRVARNGHAEAPPVFANVLPTATPGPVVTLSDACDAMQVRIDIYNEVLGHFRNMLRGNR